MCVCVCVRARVRACVRACLDVHDEAQWHQQGRHGPNHDMVNEAQHQCTNAEHEHAEHEPQLLRRTSAQLQTPAHQYSSPHNSGHTTDHEQKDGKASTWVAAAAHSPLPAPTYAKRSKKPVAPGAPGTDADKQFSNAEKQSAKRVRDKKDKEKEKIGAGVDALAEAEVCWKEEKRVPGSGLKGTFPLNQPGRYRLTARTLAPTWIPNRAMGYVMTITAAASSSSAFSTFSSSSAGVSTAAPARARRLEFGSPEFVEEDAWFVLENSDLPCKVTYSIWSHAIFKTSSVSACIQRLTPELVEEAGNVDWLVSFPYISI
jgi:hypothetical protein